MAYTSVIPVRRLDRAVKYVMNIEKTTAVSLQDALDYAANRDKTEQSCFESSDACTLETAFADMRQTKERWHKTGGVQGYHLVQSFAAGEVSPELAHQIAKELADRVLGGRYEYVIGTHLNTGHIHSHIVWNSVSCVDGKKYRSSYKSYVTEIRAVSDELCRKYKLSVIDTENSNHVAKPYAEWLAEKNNQPTWRTAIRQDVDEAIRQSLTWRQFLTVLDRKGYEVRMRRKYPVLRPPRKRALCSLQNAGQAVHARSHPDAHPVSTKLSPVCGKSSFRSTWPSAQREEAPSQADRAAGVVLSLSIRIGCAPSQAAQLQLCRAAGCLQVRPAHPTDGVPVQKQY